MVVGMYLLKYGMRPNNEYAYYLYNENLKIILIINYNNDILIMYGQWLSNM